MLLWQRAYMQLFQEEALSRRLVYLYVPPAVLDEVRRRHMKRVVGAHIWMWCGVVWCGVNPLLAFVQLSFCMASRVRRLGWGGRTVGVVCRTVAPTATTTATTQVRAAASHSPNDTMTASHRPS